MSSSSLRPRKPPSSSASSSSSSSSSSSPRSRLRPPFSSALTNTPSLSINLLLFLIAFRLLNAFTVRTFFQPDEFFQSLEPAWKAAFGVHQGAWITWEWTHQLRSSLHPLFFAAVYSVADVVAQLLRLSPATRADLLVAAPKTAQAVIAAVGDFYTWKLARHVYGTRSDEAWTTLALTVVSPWQWFCSTRTLSNCLETTITIVALNFWPWSWSVDPSSSATQRRTTRAASRERRERKDATDSTSVNRLRRCLVLAAIACILRPTNILIWSTLAGVAWLRTSWAQRRILVREALLCGSAVVLLSSLADRLFYGFWTFPPLRFLYFNIAQSLAVFYGRNDWHYYISQGLPLLLTTALPFTLVGLYRALAQLRTSASGPSQRLIPVQLALISVVMPLVLSFISHKEVRFIYPLLPLLHVLTAPPLVDYFRPAVLRSSQSHMPRRLTLIFLLLVNVVIALYTTITHASGPPRTLSYLRQQHDVHAGSSTALDHPPNDHSERSITAGFLMPCHSTPWRSHLVYPSIHAWALSCEPPVGLSAAEKATYLDEADQFYANPAQFLRDHMLEPTLRNLLRTSSYAECHRTFNTAWHDDRRRTGDIVVWCLDPAEQHAWRTATRQRDAESRDRQFDRIIEGFRREASGTRPAWSWDLVPFRSWISSPSASSSFPTLSWSWPKSWPWSSPSWSWSWSWSWPWQPKRHTWFGIQVPPLWTPHAGPGVGMSVRDWFPSWGGKKTKPKTKPKPRKNVNRDLWS